MNNLSKIERDSIIYFTANPPLIDPSIKSFCIGSKSMLTDASSQQRFLFGKDDEKANIELYEESFYRVRDSNALLRDTTLDDILLKIKSEHYSITRHRVKTGYDSGFIDYVNGAIILTSEGWINADGLKVLESEASSSEVTGYIEERSTIIPSLTTSDIVQATQDGVLAIDGVIIATLNSRKEWVSDLVQGTFADTDLVRLLAHMDTPIAVYGGTREDFFHGVVSNSEDPIKSPTVRLGSSRQGDGFYATSSYAEALKVYGNPNSFEVKGKLGKLDDNGEISKSEYLHGHVYSVKTPASVYDANLHEIHTGFDVVPSLSAMMLLAKHSGVNDKLAYNCWLKAKSSISSFGVYAAINEFNNAMIASSGRNDGIIKLISGMGFEAIKIDIPSKSDIVDAENAIKKLEESPDLLSTRAIHNTIVNYAKTALKEIVESIPAKAEKSHLIVFNVNNAEITHKKHISYSKESTHEQEMDLWG